MKKTNFLKGLAMAAIALVSVFTTSCSEEELSIKGTEVKIPELAAAKVQLAISVVDLENSKTLAQTIEDVTAKMGTTYSVACPNFAEKSQYTTTKNIEVQVPTIEKGQAVIIPVTFYVVSLNSALKDAMENIKRKTFFRGSLAYFLGIFTTLIKKKGANLEIELDGEIRHKGKLLLTSIANGRFCGGGIKSNPGACVHDGLMNVNIIYNVSRFKFIRLLPHCMKGTHLGLKGIEKVITNVGCRKMKITPCDGAMRLCTDGEITSAGVTEFELLHDAFSFVIPKEKSPILR
jgi:hypothetical protein